MMIETEHDGGLERLVRFYVKQSLRWISPVDLVGIEAVRLVRRIPTEVVDINEAIRDLYVGYGPVRAVYARGSGAQLPQILLSMEGLRYQIPLVGFLSPMPVVVIASILAHETAHHLKETRGYVFLPGEKYPEYSARPGIEEEMANRYAFLVVQRMLVKWRYRFGAYLMNSFSNYYFGLAMAAWEAKDYRGSAEKWHKSWLLNSERQEAVEWFWHSKRKLGNERESGGE